MMQLQGNADSFDVPQTEKCPRVCICVSEHLKSTSEKMRESELMKRLLEIVNDRNAIVDGLEEDRLRSDDLNHASFCVSDSVLFKT